MSSCGSTSRTVRSCCQAPTGRFDAATRTITFHRRRLEHPGADHGHARPRTRVARTRLLADHRHADRPRPAGYTFRRLASSASTCATTTRRACIVHESGRDTTVTVGGPGDDYTIRLTSQPTADVRRSRSSPTGSPTPSSAAASRCGRSARPDTGCSRERSRSTPSTRRITRTRRRQLPRRRLPRGPADLVRRRRDVLQDRRHPRHQRHVRQHARAHRRARRWPALERHRTPSRRVAATITFTPANWATPVTVALVADAALRGAARAPGRQDVRRAAAPAVAARRAGRGRGRHDARPTGRCAAASSCPARPTARCSGSATPPPCPRAARSTCSTSSTTRASRTTSAPSPRPA